MKAYKVWKKGQIVETFYPGNYAGITTMKIFGCLDCKSGMRAKKENRIFFHFWEDAIEAGFRPCKNCKPEKFALRANCQHMPFGLSGGMSLGLQPTQGKRIRVFCALCEKTLGYATVTRRGQIRWNGGIIIPHEELLRMQ